MLKTTWIVKCALLFATILGANITCAGTAAGDENSDNTFIFYWENDVVGEADGHYTNGLKLLWLSGPLNDFAEDTRLPDWSNKPIGALPIINPPVSTKHVALVIGQQIFTPEDLENPDLIVDDRPYAGWTYAGIALHSKSERLLDSFELDLGMIGPESYARDVQEKVHDLLDSEEPRGWEHQLNNEVGVILVYERKWRLWQLGFENFNIVDFVPHLGMALGNVYTYANAGGEIRLGINLPDDFGTALIRPAGDASIPAVKANNKAGVHLFAAVDGRSVARNIFLDGNTFTDSHEVDKEDFVADIMAGVSMHFSSYKITYSHVYKTKEFKAQQDEQIIGSISVSHIF